MTDKASIDVPPETREQLRQLADGEKAEAAVLEELVDEVARRRDLAADRWPAGDYY